MRLLGSFSFRLALIQVGIFSMAVALLLGAFWWISLSIPMNEVQTSLAVEARLYEKLYRERGAEALARSLDARAGTEARRDAYHVLIDAAGHRVASNVPSWPAARGAEWVQVNADRYRNGIEVEHEALMLDTVLPDGGRLLIGRDVEDLDRIWRAIRRALTYVFPPMLLLVLLAGWITSRAIGKRIDTMSRAARRVMDGNLSERVPLRGGNDDFDKLGETLNAMLDRIEASLESVRRVSDTVAHELRTPLARLEAALAELRNAPSACAPMLTERAHGEAERLSRIADAVMRISRIETKRHLALMAPVPLADLLEDAVDYHAPEAESRGQTLTADVTPGLSVHGEADLIFQAVSNLLDNAIKFTPRGGTIALTARREEDGSVCVAIQDSGPGIAPQFIEKAGERFFRAPDTASIPGFGLGLALVNAVATVHGSTLKLENAEPGLRVVWRLAGA